MAVGAVLLLAGCGSSTGGQAEGVATTTAGQELAADVPAGFDPCKDIPESVLDSEGLHKASSNNNADFDGAGGTKWRGCSWVVSDGYAAGITTTNLTVEQVLDNPKLTVRGEYTIAGRSAVAASRSDNKNPRALCTLTVAMQGGGLEFSLDNPDSNELTGHLDTCELARGLAEKVVPLLPAGA
ncbi:DUF3558 domain-containing protein [Nocardia sp. NPDC058658]|uniref:DUF3558 domain-containing protein n=1 Tax=Nocardia sp. NPDC058658 TaxID=3346580 RepID=UPI00364CC00A